jgi:hypothetical protein
MLYREALDTVVLNKNAYINYMFVINVANIEIDLHKFAQNCVLS